MPRTRILGTWAALGGLIGVGLLAKGAHGAGSEQIAHWLNTAGTVMLLHVCAAMIARMRGSFWASVLLLSGASMFTAALCFLSFAPDIHIPMMAPIGGMTMMAGWGWLAVREARG